MKNIDLTTKKKFIKVINQNDLMSKKNKKLSCFSFCGYGCVSSLAFDSLFWFSVEIRSFIVRLNFSENH